MEDKKDETGLLGEIRVLINKEDQSIIRVGTVEMADAVKAALKNEVGVSIEKIGGEKKTCLSDPDKDYEDSLCQIAEDMVEED